ncbi:hypothetical protein CLM82_30725, partial [Streptomyces albidoflavus]
ADWTDHVEHRGHGRLLRWVARTEHPVQQMELVPDISVLYQLVSSVRREACHWCGRALIGGRCAFCAAPDEGGAQKAQRSPMSSRPHQWHSSRRTEETSW